MKSDQARVGKMIEAAWTIFREDELKRCTTRADVVAALRKLKTRLLDDVRGAGYKDWLAFTSTLIDSKIEILTSDQPLATRKAAVKPERKGNIIRLPRFMRRKNLPPDSD